MVDLIRRRRRSIFWVLGLQVDRKNLMEVSFTDPQYKQ